MPPRVDNNAVAAAEIKTVLAKVKEPRVLGTKETRENLDHWLEQFKAYWKRDDRAKIFLRDNTTWNCAQDNAGFDDEGEDSKLKRDPAELSEDLEDFLNALAGHLPFPYITNKLKTTSTSWKSCKQAVYEIYGVKTSAGTLLDLGNVKKTADETYRQFYERMAGHMETHLPFPEAEATYGGIRVPAQGEKMTVALHNLLVIDWLKAIDPKLIGLVKTAYSKELKARNAQLYELMPDIAENIDELLNRNETMVQTITDQMEEISIKRIRERNFGDKNRGTGRGRGRGRAKSGDSQFSANLCPKCVNLQSELTGARISANHHPADCPNKRAYVRRAETVEEDYSKDDQYDNFDDDEDETDGETAQQSEQFMQFSNPVFKVTESRVCTNQNSQHRSDIQQDSQEMKYFIEDSNVTLSDPALENLQSKLNRVEDIATKAESPALWASYRGIDFIVVADSGAELNCIDQKLADDLGIKYIKTRSSANAAGQSSVAIKGQTANDLIIQTEFHGTVVNLNLQKAVVVYKLGADMLLGEPGLKNTGLKTDATKGVIELTTNDGKYYRKPYISGVKKSYQVCRIEERQHIYPGETLEWEIPNSLPSDGIFCIVPQRDKVAWYDPGIYRANNGTVRLVNTSTNTVFIKKGDHVGEARTCERHRPIESSIKKIETLPQCQFRYEKFGKTPETVKEPDIDLDPDNIMPNEEKKRFRSITNDFAEIFTKQPGKYNGFYGRVNNTLNFASKPPPNKRIYQPQYSEVMKRKQADLMDTLYDYGVLRTPEEIGISVENISPSLLVAKSTPGEFRLVTDLSNINTHIKKCPAVSPIISEAKAMLAKKKFFIHLDLANYFFQSGMNKEDCQYLGTVHPYKGTMVYVVEPQGLRNASEHGYEVLARIYGNMCQVGDMTRMADSLFVLGDSYDELAENYREVLLRAKQSGLTFKPGKVVICPLKTVLFGWELDGTKWSPTSHTVSALARAPPPTTIKGLRSFLGSFKQFTECVSGYANILHDLDLVCAGRASAEKINWTDDLLATFEAAKAATSRVEGVHLPRPSDVLKTFSDYSQENKAIGGRMEIHRMIDGKTVKLHGGYVSQVLNKLKSKWLPCEGESLGIKLVLEHFAPFLRENDHVTTHYTDNAPCVQAWKRSLYGAFSSSARIAQFLTGLSGLPVELQHKAGVKMNTSDYLSRNPTPCGKPEQCQMCKFAEKMQAEGENTKNIKSIKSVTVQDVMEGNSLMPYTQRKSWLGAQLMDSVHTQLKTLIETGQLPDKRKTNGEATKLKQLHTLYSKGDLKICPDGLVVVKHPMGYFGGWAISVPHKIFPGLANALHISLQHPSRAQLASVMARYFYCPGHTALIHEVADSCTLCRSLQKLPKSFMENTTEKVSSLGSEFAVDIMERNSQKIFLAREKLSQYTWLQLVPDQTRETLRTAILKSILPWVGQAGATVRCDGATALASLAAESDDTSSILYKNKIKIDIGRLHNKNKNPVAENAVRECAKEIIRHKPHVNILTDDDLSIVQKSMNDRIRSRGLAAKEILLRRDLLSSEPKDVNDKILADQQNADRQAVTNRDKESNPLENKPNFRVGDLVLLKEQLSKHQPRQTFIVTAIKEDQVEIQKLHTQFRQKKYRVYPDEIVHATANAGLFNKNRNPIEKKVINSSLSDVDNIRPTQPLTPKCDTIRPQLRPPRKAKEKAIVIMKDMISTVTNELEGENSVLSDRNYDTTVLLGSDRTPSQVSQIALKLTCPETQNFHDHRTPDDVDDWRKPKSGCKVSTQVDDEDEVYLEYVTISVTPAGGDENEDSDIDPEEPPANAGTVDPEQVEMTDGVEVKNEPEMIANVTPEQQENNVEFFTPEDGDISDQPSQQQSPVSTGLQAQQVRLFPPGLADPFRASRTTLSPPPARGFSGAASRLDEVVLGHGAPTQDLTAVMDQLTRSTREKEDFDYAIYTKTGIKVPRRK